MASVSTTTRQGRQLSASGVSIIGARSVNYRRRERQLSASGASIIGVSRWRFWCGSFQCETWRNYCEKSIHYASKSLNKSKNKNENTNKWVNNNNNNNNNNNLLHILLLFLIPILLLQHHRNLLCSRRADRSLRWCSPFSPSRSRSRMFDRL